jgi:hypothetical protein
MSQIHPMPSSRDLRALADTAARGWCPHNATEQCNQCMDAIAAALRAYAEAQEQEPSDSSTPPPEATAAPAVDFLDQHGESVIAALSPQDGQP